MGNILHMTLRKEPFDAILRGDKKVEYRVIKPYWQKRLFTKDGVAKQFDYVVFTNGYGGRVPRMKVEFKGVKVTDHYEILLGAVVETHHLNH